MLIKLGEVRSIMEGLGEILEKDLPVKAAYRFGKALAVIQGEAKAFDAARIKIIEKYAKWDEMGAPMVDEKTNTYVLADEESFNKEFLDLANEEVELDIKTVPLEALGDVMVKPSILARLDRFIEE